MPHLTINGVTLPGRADTVEESPEYVGDLMTRSVNGQLREQHVAKKLIVSGVTVARSPTDALALQKLLEGLGQSWPYNTNAYSALGVAPNAGTYTISATTKYGAGSLSVTSTNFVEYALAEKLLDGRTWTPTKGWTWMGWIKVGAGSWGHFIATGSVAFARASAANPVGVTQYSNGVGGTYGIGYLLDVNADGTVGWYGYTGAGAGANVLFDDVVFLPFAIPASFAPGLYALANARAWPVLPRVLIDGDGVEEADGIEVIARTARVKQRNIVLGGVQHNAARVLEFDATEV